MNKWKLVLVIIAIWLAAGLLFVVDVITKR